MKKIFTALILMVLINGNLLSEELNSELNFKYVNNINCPDTKNFKIQKTITDNLFGKEISDKLGCNINKSFDIPLICKFSNDINNDNQRCFGLNLFSSNKKRTQKSILISATGLVPGSAFLDYEPIFSNKWINIINEEKYFLKTRVEKIRNKKGKKVSKIVKKEKTYCSGASLNIKYDWFYIIEDLMMNNGWKIVSTDIKDRKIFLKPGASKYKILTTKTSIQGGSMSLYPGLDEFIEKSFSTHYNPYLTNNNVSESGFVLMKKGNIYAEFSWLDEGFREFISFDMPNRIPPDATLFIYESESKISNSRDIVITETRCQSLNIRGVSDIINSPFINNTIHQVWVGDYNTYLLEKNENKKL